MSEELAQLLRDKVAERLKLLKRKIELEAKFDMQKDLSGGMSQAELDEYSLLCKALGQHV